jgi:hypothetical protein
MTKTYERPGFARLVEDKKIQATLPERVTALEVALKKKSRASDDHDDTKERDEGDGDYDNNEDEEKPKKKNKNKKAKDENENNTNDDTDKPGDDDKASTTAHVHPFSSDKMKADKAMADQIIAAGNKRRGEK